MNVLVHHVHGVSGGGKKDGWSGTSRVYSNHSDPGMRIPQNSVFGGDK